MSWQHRLISTIRPAPSLQPARTSSLKTVPWLAWGLLLLGVGGFVGLWITLGFHNGRQNTWMAVLGALDIAWMLRLGGWPPGRGRMVTAVIATGLIVLLSNWGIAAAHLGSELGLQPWASALKLGSDHAWTLAQLANSTGDALWIAAALMVAALTAR